MVAIKDMEEMPKACTSTQEILGDIEVVDCPLYNVCKHRDTIRVNYKPSDCPLVEIITCKDCKHWDKRKYRGNTCYCEMRMIHTDPNEFCNEAMRK